MPGSDATEPRAPDAGGDAAAVVEVETGEGRGRFFVSPANDPRAVLVLGHGAGGGVDAVDLEALARGLPAHGISVVRFEQPWRTAGGRVAVRPPRLDAAWTDALDQVLVGRLVLPGVDAAGPVVVGGRSAGARVACRTSRPGAAGGDLSGRVRGVLACAFPLHPPGRPDRSRIAELAGVDVPCLVLQGERDSFGSAADLRAALSGLEPAGSNQVVRVVAVPGADHSLRVSRTADITPAGVRRLLVERAAAFVTDVLRPADDVLGDGPGAEPSRE